MGVQTEVSNFDATVDEIEITDAVLGGPGGPANSPIVNLTNRTRWLYNTLTNLIPTVALINSPTFTGTVSGPTPAAGDSSSTYPTTAFVSNAVRGILALSVAGNSNVTLTPVQYGTGIIQFTGVLTGNINVIVPVSGQWEFINATTGGFTLRVKTAGGSGILITQGKQTRIVADGTNANSGNTDYNNIALAGVCTAPTAAPLTSSLQISSTAYADASSAAAVAAIPYATTTINGLIGLATISETRTGTDATLAVTAAGAAAVYAPISGAALTNGPTAPTQAANDNSTKLATTAYADRSSATAVSGIPNATTSVYGLARLATNSETVTGTNTSDVTTPAGVAAAIAAIAGVATATTSVSGISKLATNAETVTGTNATDSTTPAGVAAAIAAIAYATTVVNGIVGLATISETRTGTDATLAVTAAGAAAVYAPITNAALLGIVTVPNVAASDSSTKAANTAYADASSAAAVAAIPTTTTGLRGLAQLATTAQTVTGTSTALASTPAGVAAAIAAIPPIGAATTSVQGIVKLATNSETITGTNATDSVTPAGLAAALAGLPRATTAIPGIVELATVSEAIAGTNATDAVTPAGLAGAMANFPISKVIGTLNQNYSNGSLVGSFANTLSKTYFAVCTITCVTPELGFSTGQNIQVNQNGDNDTGVSVFWDNSVYGVNISNIGIQTVRADNHAIGNITPSNWTISIELFGQA